MWPCRAGTEGPPRRGGRAWRTASRKSAAEEDDKASGPVEQLRGKEKRLKVVEEDGESLVDDSDSSESPSEDEGSSSGISGSEAEEEVGAGGKPTTSPMQRDLSHVSFEELLRMQNSMGTRAYQETGGKKTANPTKPRIKQQQSKKGPVEMSAKKPVSFLRQVVPVTKKVQRDPRFDDLSGEYNPEIFLKTYSFLDSIKKQEKEMIQKQLKKCRNVEQKEKLQQLLKRVTQQEEEQKKKQKWRERELSLKRQQRELAQQGKKPFYLKKSEKRKLELAEKYAELKRSGKLESFLNKRRKRNAIKDKCRLPSQKSL
uniref:rRNA biogenesis protein RRP36 n=1 Tax=Dromaius novaehollandiae TaxID=8790 RepID=A0A8C4KGM4_DRONO|nr:ribosomal RNA processing protein 36 homolog isoform X1 [Dromaius novaehollandiae]